MNEKVKVEQCIGGVWVELVTIELADGAVLDDVIKGLKDMVLERHDSYTWLTKEVFGVIFNKDQGPIRFMKGD